MYEYNAMVTNVYDGDTVTCDVDLGMKTFAVGEKIRLAGIDAPELRGDSMELGIKSRDALRDLVLHKQVFLTTLKDKRGKYGRYIGILILKDGTIVNQKMVDDGFAVTRDYD